MRGKIAINDQWSMPVGIAFLSRPKDFCSIPLSPHFFITLTKSFTSPETSKRIHFFLLSFVSLDFYLFRRFVWVHVKPDNSRSVLVVASLGISRSTIFWSKFWLAEFDYDEVARLLWWAYMLWGHWYSRLFRQLKWHVDGAQASWQICFGFLAEPSVAWLEKPLQAPLSSQRYVVTIRGAWHGKTTFPPLAVTH